jgi:hypothetical protein
MMHGHVELPKPHRAITFMTKSPCSACVFILWVMAVALPCIIASWPPDISASRGDEDVFNERTMNKDIVSLGRAWASEKLVGIFQSANANADAVEQQTQKGAFVSMIFYNGGANILTDDNVAMIRKTEQLVLADPKYSQYCLRGKDGQCSPSALFSITNYIYAEYNTTSNQWINNGLNTTARPTRDVLAMLTSSPKEWKRASFFFDLSFVPSDSTKWETAYTRSFMQFGLPRGVREQGRQGA